MRLKKEPDPSHQDGLGFLMFSTRRDQAPERGDTLAGANILSEVGGNRNRSSSQRAQAVCPANKVLTVMQRHALSTSYRRMAGRRLYGGRQSRGETPADEEQ